MSQPNRKYKRLEALLSETKPVQPDPVPAPAKQEVDELKAQVAELEAKLTEQKPAKGPIQVAPAAEMVMRPLPAQASKEDRVTVGEEPGSSDGLSKRFALWVMGVFAAVGLAFFGYGIINLFFLQGGQADISDKILIPYTILIVIVNLASYRLIRRDHLALAGWMSFLVGVVFLPALTTLFIANINVLASGYIFIFSVLYISLIIPKTARSRAVIIAAAGILTIMVIETWNPAYRVGTEHLETFTPYVILISVLAILALVIRQVATRNIHTKLTIFFIIFSLLTGVFSYTLLKRVIDPLADDTIPTITKVKQTERLTSDVQSETAAFLASGDTKHIENLNLTSVELSDLAEQFDKVLADDPEEAEQFSKFAQVAQQIIVTAQNTIKSHTNTLELLETLEVLGADAQTIFIDSQETTSAEINRNAEEGDLEELKSDALPTKKLVDELITGLYRLQIETIQYISLNEGTTLDEITALEGHLDEIQRELDLVLETDEAGEGDLAARLDAVDEEIRNTTRQVINSHNQTRELLEQQETLTLEFEAASAEVDQTVEEEVESSTTGALTNALFYSLGIFILAAFVGYWLANTIAKPIIKLVTVANQIADGNLAIRAEVNSRDEIGTLASAFNTMTSQLRNLFGSLEQRVLDRTHDLELASEVGRTATEKVANANEMLTAAAEMIRSRFGLYYTQVYLLNPSGNTLTLRAGTGGVGQQLLQRGHHLLVSSDSLNGRAVSEKKPIIVPDTAKNPNFLPNPLLPNTRSEMAVPLIVSGRVLGVLDMQSEIPDALNQANLPAFETLAGQLSIAIQNATLFAQSEEARKQVEANVRQITESGWGDFLNAIERGEKIGYTFNQTDVIPMENMNGMESANALKVPITVTGANVGSIQLVEEERNWTAQETEIVQAAAEQLAQHLDNLRLLAQAEGYRSEAEQAVRRLTREGWETFVQTRNELTSGFTYDLNNVHALEGGKNNGHFESAITKQFVVRNETVGELAVNIGDKSPEDMNDLINAVAEQLGGHIENLRLSEQNEKRAFELATVATVSTTASTVLDPDKLLQSVVDLTKERFNMYHAHIYLADESWNTLLLAAGAGEIGRQMVNTGHAIQMDTEKSLVARAARERKSIIVNNVRIEAGYLPNVMLPETRSEMAVPMIVGDKVIGVFDVQADTVGHFTDQDANIYTTLASQVAVALQNARLYVEQAATVTQLRELDRLKSSFLANMSHELRTPLNSILGFADVMLEELDGPLTENMGNDLSLIHKNGQHLLHLINDVLDMAKIDSGKMIFNIEKFNLHETIEEVVSITSPLASEKNLSLFIKPDSDREVNIHADKIRLRQVMINLINNAMKFTERGNIAICVAREENNVLISVKDTGIGIPVEMLESVFEEFTQVDTTTTRKTGGTGLGLPISRRLIQMHSGRLWAESSGIDGEGTTFFVILPIEAKIDEEEPKVK